MWRSCSAISTCAGTVCAVVLGGLARASRPADSPPTAGALSALRQALQRFSVSYRAQISGCALPLCCGSLAARPAPALVPCAASFLRGLPERVDPLTLRLPLARSRPCGRRCNGFQFRTERKSANKCARVPTTRSHTLYKCTEFTVVVSTELIVHLLRIGHACTVYS